jgi:hypothetical protein
MQEDDAGAAFALGFLLRDDDALGLQLDMPRRDVTGLLRPATGVPREFQQIAERIALCVAAGDAGKILRSRATSVQIRATCSSIEPDRATIGPDTRGH